MYKREDAYTLSFILKDIIASMYVYSVWAYWSSISKKDCPVYVDWLQVRQGYI
jgi:hypothetical protein